MHDNSEFKILIVDDVAFNIEVAVSFLQPEHYSLYTVESAKGALKAAFSQPFDLILLDINMPEMDGYEVCKRLKKDTQTKDIPIIFLSAMDDIDAITKAFEMGAVDYLSKPFNGLELIARVRTQIQLRKYVKELQEKQGKLAQLAATDTLTGLSNKLHFMSIFKKAFTHSTHNLSLAYISVDHMHKINNMYGFKVGDKVLIKIAKTLQEHARDRDTPARLFGSEFIFLMPKTPFEDAKVLMKELMQKIDKIPSDAIKIACSIGVSSFKEESSPDDFILRCETLMQEAKDLGGNRVISRI